MPIHADLKEWLVRLKEDASLTNFTFFGSSDDPLSAEDIFALAEALEASKALENFTLVNVKLSELQIRTLAEALSHHKNISSLMFFNNNLGVEGAKALAELLKRNRNITTLGIIDNKLGVQGAKVLAQVLKDCENLKELTLEDNLIGSEGSEALAKALVKIKELTRLNLADNNIDDAGIQAISVLLAQSEQIDKLDLSRNSIRVEGMKALAFALRENRSLQWLDLSANGLDDKEIDILVEVLKYHHTLKVLNLSQNKIGDIGAKQLANALVENSSLTALDCENNIISDEGASAIGEALKVNDSLTALNLSANQIKTEGLKQMAERVRENSSLTRFVLDEWDALMTSDDEDNQADWLERNRLFSQFTHYIKVAKSYAVHLNADKSPQQMIGVIKEIAEENAAIADGTFDNLLDDQQILMDKLILDILIYRSLEDKAEIALKAQAILASLEALVGTLNIPFDDLSPRSYLRKFATLIAGEVNLLNSEDEEAQRLAITYLIQPFNDSELQKEAMMKLVPLIDSDEVNRYLTADAKKALDFIMLDFSIRMPHEKDFTFIALNAYIRLINAGKLSYADKTKLHKELGVNITNHYKQLIQATARDEKLQPGEFILKCRESVVKSLAKPIKKSAATQLHTQGLYAENSKKSKKSKKSTAEKVGSSKPPHSSPL